jgi:hypothetical protein
MALLLSARLAVDIEQYWCFTFKGSEYVRVRRNQVGKDYCYERKKAGRKGGERRGRRVSARPSIAYYYSNVSKEQPPSTILNCIILLDVQRCYQVIPDLPGRKI